jgi:hypothetical protein
MIKFMGPAQYSDAARLCEMAGQAREMQRNRLCELLQDPSFNEWWQLTLALGPETCLLLLASEVAKSATGAEIAEALRELLPDAQTPGAAGSGEDRWVNPLFPLLPPQQVPTIPLRIPAQLESGATSAAASAE